MIDRIRKAQREDSGFTLIELLVVVIIIGILAAIAIPTFLAQRESSWQSAVETDLRNAATAMESYAADNNGSYPGTATDATTVLGDYGFNSTEGVTVAIDSSGGGSYVLTGSHDQEGVDDMMLDSSNGTVVTGTPGA